ncbi:hypothetical protein OBBRIDRAFT_490318 [Obba rivulosa]|uniref:Uncharacterized protein n=1 Tax=Obba rivulosa TaxID=1052685 RepID=A0A8E2AWP5_9APHY|nr:hypothetical protein OBBRIDRAFT_490318 [Obba rivulosa]
MIRIRSIQVNIYLWSVSQVPYSFHVECIRLRRSGTTWPTSRSSRRAKGTPKLLSIRLSKYLLCSPGCAMFLSLLFCLSMHRSDNIT